MAKAPILVCFAGQTYGLPRPTFAGYSIGDDLDTIRHMSRNTHVFGWDEEPSDERPSEFARTTGYSVLSGYHHPTDLNQRVARRQGNTGFGRLVLAFALFLGVSGYALYVFAKMIQG